MDVGVIRGRIARVAANLPAAHARTVVDAGQYYVTPGLIDIHMHLGSEGVRPDHNCLPNGVTTAVDAGGASTETFEEFKRTVIDHAKTRVLAWLAVPAGSSPEAAAQMVRKHRAAIVGLTARGADAMDSALQAAAASSSVVLAETASDATRLRPRDIQSPVNSLRIAPDTVQMRKRGVLFDVGHGFSFRVGGAAVRDWFPPDLISTGMDRQSATLPRATMMDVMSKLLNLGMSIDEMVERATVRAARAIGHTEIGSLSEGADADIAVLAMEKGSFGFLDSTRVKLAGDKRLRCVMTVRNGAVVWDSEGLAAPDWIKAGPYTNFK
jgi:dihydroorotase